MTKFNLPPVCLIIDSKEFPQKLELALKAGIKWIQYREKNLSRRKILEYAYKIREITSKYGSILTINDYLDIAISVKADGVHFGQEDFPAEEAKRLFSGIIGISTHNINEAKEAEIIGVDYIGFGPVFKTTTKKDALEPRETSMISFICKKINIPVVLIGGIKIGNVSSLLEKGCRHVAVSSGILEGDITCNVRNLLNFFKFD